MDDPSITALKSAFIRTQVRHLEAPLEAPDLALSSPPTSDSQLTAKLQADLVNKVNEKIRQHNRLIFSTQSQRHIAEQLESLHWNFVDAETERAEIDTVGVRRDAELTDAQTVQGLPDELEELCLHPDHEERGAEQDEYAALRAELVELSEKREALKRRLEQYRRIRTLMAPLEEPLKDVQPNLVTRDGELNRELDRMRLLLARVTKRVEDSQRLNDSDDSGRPRPRMVETDQQKLARLLEFG